MATTLDKREAQALLGTLPAETTWEALLDKIETHWMIARGRADAEAGRVKSLEELRAATR